MKEEMESFTLGLIDRIGYFPKIDINKSLGKTTITSVIRTKCDDTWYAVPVITEYVGYDTEFAIRQYIEKVYIAQMIHLPTHIDVIDPLQIDERERMLGELRWMFTKANEKHD